MVVNNGYIPVGDYTCMDHGFYCSLIKSSDVKNDGRCNPGNVIDVLHLISHDGRSAGTDGDIGTIIDCDIVCDDVHEWSVVPDLIHVGGKIHESI